MARLNGLRVVRSPVEGYGVIATRRFCAGSVVADVDGVLWRLDEPRDDKYSLEIGDGVFFDMVDQTRFINHSCLPNLLLERGVYKSGNGWAQFQAARDILPGEELFYDYGFNPAQKEPCYCGTIACRGWIVDESYVLTPPAVIVSAPRPRQPASPPRIRRSVA